MTSTLAECENFAQNQSCRGKFSSKMRRRRKFHSKSAPLGEISLRNDAAGKNFSVFLRSETYFEAKMFKFLAQKWHRRRKFRSKSAPQGKISSRNGAEGENFAQKWRRRRKFSVFWGQKINLKLKFSWLEVSSEVSFPHFRFHFRFHFHPLKIFASTSASTSTPQNLSLPLPLEVEALPLPEALPSGSLTSLLITQVSETINSGYYVQGP